MMQVCVPEFCIKRIAIARKGCEAKQIYCCNELMLYLIFKKEVK